MALLACWDWRRDEIEYSGSSGVGVELLSLPVGWIYPKLRLLSTFGQWFLTSFCLSLSAGQRWSLGNDEKKTGFLLGIAGPLKLSNRLDILALSYIPSPA